MIVVLLELGRFVFDDEEEEAEVLVVLGGMIYSSYWCGGLDWWFVGRGSPL
jgi:hypothetical protein